MMKVSICPAVAEDAEALSALNAACFGLSYPAKDVEKQIKAVLNCTDECLLVAVYRGATLGYIHARIDRRVYRAPRVAVLAVAVDKEHRRKHIATDLVNAVVKWASKHTCQALTAAVGGSRAAQAFFSSIGCEEGLNRKQYITLLGDGVAENGKA